MPHAMWVQGPVGTPTRAAGGENPGLGTASVGLGNPITFLRVWGGGGADFGWVTEKLFGNPAGLGAGQEEDGAHHHLGGSERPPERATSRVLWKGHSLGGRCSVAA